MKKRTLTLLAISALTGLSVISQGSTFAGEEAATQQTTQIKSQQQVQDGSQQHQRIYGSQLMTQEERN